ncbi:hypothetical protein [Acinetobacter sp. HY1485]|uniref:hypothetical protein n=1 Tax=Acinetobacter sp. HY1485 TaxID=2970918 RepID=UPI0022B9844E|nr:hypothetical protein [Acinetobacter sp. HY1485]
MFKKLLQHTILLSTFLISVDAFADKIQTFDISAQEYKNNFNIVAKKQFLTPINELYIQWYGGDFGTRKFFTNRENRAVKLNVQLDNSKENKVKEVTTSLILEDKNFSLKKPLIESFSKLSLAAFEVLDSGKDDYLRDEFLQKLMNRLEKRIQKDESFSEQTFYKDYKVIASKTTTSLNMQFLEVSIAPAEEFE